MLAQWASPEPLPVFMRRCLRRRPCARPGAAAAAVPFLDWDVLGRVLAAEPRPDVVVVARGSLVAAPAPRSLDQLRVLMRDGVGLVVRQAERQDAGLRALAAAFERDLPGEAHVQLFATPSRAHGFGWQYDLEDVFIAQTAGAKDYYFRENTVARPPISRQARLDFSPFRRETSPLGTAHLVKGDWLYVPARWWRFAQCLEDSLSIAVGVFPSDETLRAAGIEP